MSSIYRFAAIAVCMVLIVAGYGSVQGADQSVVKSTDGISQITIPKGWKAMKDLNDEASLQAAYPLKELYVIVMTEAKEDFDKMTMEKYSELTRGAIVEALSNGKEEKLGAFKIDGKRALQYKLEGTMENIKVVYIHTTVEGKKHFHYILAWTLKSKYKKSEDVLQQVIKSFKER